MVITYVAPMTMVPKGSNNESQTKTFLLTLIVSSIIRSKAAVSSLP